MSKNEMRPMMAKVTYMQSFLGETLKDSYITQIDEFNTESDVVRRLHEDPHVFHVDIEYILGEEK